MQTKTKSVVVHTTTLSSTEKQRDGGKSLLNEAFDFIHSERQVGTLTAQFGPGGSISSLSFSETAIIPQSAIEVAE